MTVLQVLETASLYLDILDDIEPILKSDKSSEIDVEVQKEFDKVINALNLVVLEILGEYSEVLTEEKIEFKDNVFDM